MWAGIAIAVLDVTGLGRYIDMLLDSVRHTASEELRDRKNPHRRWSRGFYYWFSANCVLLLVKLGIYRVADDDGSEIPAASYEESVPGERKFRKVFFTSIFAVFSIIVAATALLPLFAIWFGFYQLIIDLGMPWVEASAITGSLLIASLIVVGREIAELVSGATIYLARHLFALGMVVVTTVLVFPLYPFRKIQAGYLSGLGLIVALASAF